MDPSLSVALYRRYWSYMSLSLWGEVGPLGLGEGELACGIVWPCMCSAVLFAWLELGWVRWLWSSLRLRASSPLPSGIRLPPSPKGDGFWLLHMLYGVAQKGRLFLGLLLCSRWGGGGCFSFLIFTVVQKNPTSFEVGFLILDFSIYILSFTWVIVAAITW